MELISSLKSKIFGNGTIAFHPNRSLQCDLSLSGKTVSFNIPIKTNIWNVSSLIVRDDNAYVLLVYAYGILVVKTVSIVMYAARAQNQQDTISLPEINITLPGIVSCCCFNPLSKQHLHVLDNTVNFYTYDIESSEDRLVSKRRLFQQKGSRTKPFFMDIVMDCQLDLMLIVGMQSGKVYVSKFVDPKQLCELKSDLEFSSSKLDMIVPGKAMMRRLEEYNSMVFYCMISPRIVAYLMYLIHDKQMVVLEVHSFDQDSKVVIDQVKREVVVGESRLSYQWIFDVIYGKEVWERFDENDKQDSEAFTLLLSRREMQKTKELTKTIQDTFQVTKSLETFMNKSMIDITIATLNTYCCLSTHTTIR